MAQPLKGLAPPLDIRDQSKTVLILITDTKTQPPGLVSALKEQTPDTGIGHCGGYRAISALGQEIRTRAGLEMEAILPATPRHTMFPLWLLPSGSDQVHG